MKSGSPNRKRGAADQADNRFDAYHFEPSDELEIIDRPSTKTEFLPDTSLKVLSENRSPDVNFRYSVNPYRGCEHGCAYCYARPTHEYLGMSAGLDFESKIVVKHDVAKQLEKEFGRRGYQCGPIMLSGVTDCYQPIERKLQLTRSVLQLCLKYKHPITLITKNALIERDVDLLSQLAELNLVHAALSITTLDAESARSLEPRTSSPSARLRAVRTLSDAGVPMRVMTAPVIAGLNDHEIPALLTAAKEHGAVSAGYVMLRLPGSVEPVFLRWLREHRPDSADRILSRIRQTRGGKNNDSRFGSRMAGTGLMAEQIGALFKTFAANLGLALESEPLRTDQFVPPIPGGQLSLF